MHQFENNFEWQLDGMLGLWAPCPETLFVKDRLSPTHQQLDTFEEADRVAPCKPRIYPTPPQSQGLPRKISPTCYQLFSVEGLVL
eukprot:5847523-Amphidinium_carterae.1